MALSNAVLKVQILVDAAQASAGMDKAAGKFGKFGQAATNMVGPAAATAGAIIAIGAASIEAASETQQAMGGIDAVFGKSAGQVKAWADSAAEAVGLSSAQYGNLAAGLGAQLKNLGVPVDEIAGKTDNLIKMGADLAATYGGTTEEAVQALGSAMRGEADPAERYGLALSQTAIAAKMAEQGTSKLTGAAGKQAKTAALLALATEQAGGAMGQFARESDSAAGAQQIATAQFENAKAALGTELLPAVSAVMKALGKFAVFVKENSTLVSVIAGVLLVLAAAILVVAAAQWVMNAAMLANPITWIIIAIVALVVALVVLYKKSATFRAIVMGAWNGVKIAVAAVVIAVKAVGRFFQAAWRIAKAVATAIAADFRKAWQAIVKTVTAAIAAVQGIIRRIAAAARSVASSVVSAFRSAWASVKSAASAAISAVVNAVRRITAPARSAASAARNALVSAFHAIRSAASSLGGALTAPFRAVAGAVQSAISAVQNLISWLSRIKVPKISIPSGKSAPAAAGLRTAPGLRVGATAAAAPRATGGAGVVINISGALDPEAVARQIRTVLGGAQVRRRGVILAART